MKVQNKFHYVQQVKVNGISYTIPGRTGPNDKATFYLPDEALDEYKELFIIVVPPRPKVQYPSHDEMLKKLGINSFKPQVMKAPEVKQPQVKQEPEKNINIKEGKKPNPFKAKWNYTLVDPQGTEFKNVSLWKFCQINMLDYYKALEACNKNKLLKGWKITRTAK